MKFDFLLFCVIYVFINTYICKSICDTTPSFSKYDEYVVMVDGGFSNAKAVSKLHNLELYGKVFWFEKQKFLNRKKRSFNWNDPLYPDMWYLNRASKGKGYDMNVMEAWQLGYTGKGVKLTIMDDGIDYLHPDLLKTYDPEASTDINGRDNDPMPNKDNRDNKHGTRCAGQIAAQGNNSVCIVGIAYNSQIGGIRMLDGLITDRVEAESLRFRQDYIDIYSGSWGPEDSGKLYEGPGVLAQSAFQQGVITGRQGFGNIYVWASGNGGLADDSCACDGYTSSLFTLSVSGVGELNTKPWYLEKCSSTLISTYSSGSLLEQMISTIDLGHECTRMHTGTSASAPIAAAIIALMLEANNRLNWRDVQYVTLLTANTKPFKDGNFTRNAVGRLYSHLYGYGLMDAGKMVRLGKLWRNVPPHHRCISNVMNVQKKLEGKFNHTFVMEFSGCLSDANGQKRFHKRQSNGGRRLLESGSPVRFLEHVQVYTNINYQRRGLLQLSLISPNGTLVVLLPPRIHDKHSGNIAMLRWPVTTVQLWGEQALGTWQIRLDNIGGSKIAQVNPDNIKGFWRSVWIVVYGTDEYPIRLKPPDPLDPPPADWFAPFSKYVVDNSKWQKVYTCHSECSPGGCSGPSADQCSFGCKHFVTESRRCVEKCPVGTTAFGSFQNPTSVENTLADNSKALGRLRIPPPNRIRSRNLLFPFNDDNGGGSGDTNKLYRRAPTDTICQPCWSLCATCIRPYLEYDCTSCSNGRFLVPIFMANQSTPNLDGVKYYESKSRTPFQMPQRMGTCRTECPVGYYGNITTLTCDLCSENCAECSGSQTSDCRRCIAGFRFIHGKCVDGTSVNGLCRTGQYLDNSQCIDCHESCKEFGCLTNNSCVWCPVSKSNYFNGTCLASCPTGWYSGLQWTKAPFDSNFKQNLVKSISLCQPCGPGCLQCHNATSCSECTNELVLTGGLCRNPNTSSIQPLTPTQCDVDCVDCIDHLTNCFKCPTKVLLEISWTNFLPYDLNQLVVLQRAVQTEHNFLTQYACVRTCPTHYYVYPIPLPIVDANRTKDGKRDLAPIWPKHVCVLCPIGCSTCTNSTHCTSCQPQFYLNNHQSTVCILKPKCRHTEYFDTDEKKCKPCHDTCVTCTGPNPDQCATCSKHSSDNPRCLTPNIIGIDGSKNNLRDMSSRAWIGDSLKDSSINTGRCVACCSYKVALTSQIKNSCVFCVADKTNCLTGEEIGAGEGVFHIEYISKDKNQSSWTSFLKQPSRLVLFIICTVFLLLCIIFIIVHVILARTRYRIPSASTNRFLFRQRKVQKRIAFRKKQSNCPQTADDIQQTSIELEELNGVQDVEYAPDTQDAFITGSNNGDLPNRANFNPTTANINNIGSGSLRHKHVYYTKLNPVPIDPLSTENNVT